MKLGGKLVQYFQGGELVVDPRRAGVHAEALGQQAASVLAPRAVWTDARVTPGFAGAYAGFGGRNALGPALTGTVSLGGHIVQFFRDGAIVEFDGAPALPPVGDLALRLQGWLPAFGAADADPVTLAADSLADIHLPHASER